MSEKMFDQADFSTNPERISFEGPIAPGWVLVRPISAQISIDADDHILIRDAVFTTYGMGDTYQEARQNYFNALIEAYQEAKAENGDFFKSLQSYLQPLPVDRDPDQAWFWTDEWQAGEREVDAELAAGQVEEFDTIDDFLADLT
jgi:hypothetical protein